MSTNRRRNQTNNLVKGSTIYASLATWYDRKDWDKTIFGCVDAFVTHYHVGKVKNDVVDGMVKVKFNALPTVYHISRQELLRNNMYVFDTEDLPENHVILSQDIPDEQLFDILSFAHPLERPLRFGSLTREALIRQCNSMRLKLELRESSRRTYLQLVQAGVKLDTKKKIHVPCLTSAHVKRYGDAEEANSLKTDVCTILQLEFPGFDGKSFYEGLVWRLMEKMSKSLRNPLQKREGKGFRIMVPESFAKNVFAKIFKLSGFQMKRMGNGDIKLTGNIKALGKAGFLVEKHPEQVDPFVHGTFIDSKTAQYGRYYDQFRSPNTDEDYIFIINPFELTLKQLQSDPRVQTELGKDYKIDPTKGIPTVARDILYSRLSQRGHSSRHKRPLKELNFGLKNWGMVDDECGITIILEKTADGHGVLNLHMKYVVKVQGFGTMADWATGCLRPAAMEVEEFGNSVSDDDAQF